MKINITRNRSYSAEEALKSFNYLILLGECGHVSILMVREEQSLYMCKGGEILVGSMFSGSDTCEEIEDAVSVEGYECSFTALQKFAEYGAKQVTIQLNGGKMKELTTLNSTV